MKAFLHVLREGSLFLTSELNLDEEQLNVALKCDSILDGKTIYRIQETVYDVDRRRIIFRADEDEKEFTED